MKNFNFKIFLFNCLFIFTINFLLSFIFQIFQDYKYYSVYSQEEFSRYFSMQKIIFWDFSQSLYYTFMESTVFIPILLALEKINIKNFIKIIMTYIILFIAIIIYLLKNISFTF